MSAQPATDTHAPEPLTEDDGTPAPVAAEDPAPARPRRRPTRFDLVTTGLYLLGALYVTAAMWRDSTDPKRWVPDKMQVEWMLNYGAHAVTTAGNPMSTGYLNSGAGVDMMANTSMLGVTIPAAPLTLLFGSRIALVIVIILGLTATATAWYWVLSRHFVTSRMAAAIAGGFAGFSPGEIAHAGWHPHVVLQFLIPLIIWRVIKLREEGHWRRNGVILALLVVYQCFINEEALLLTVLSLALFLVVYLPWHRDELRAHWRPFVAGLAVTGVVAVVLLAYPLWMQFLGPQSYHGMPAVLTRLKLNILSYPSYPTDSIAERLTPAGITTAAEPEGNAFLGWSLLALSVFIVVWLWRSATVRALAVVGVTAGLLSLGTYPSLAGRTSSVPGPWLLFNKLPLLGDVVAIRVGLVIFPVVTFLLALATDRILTMAREQPAARGPLRMAWAGALVAALLPLFPLPVPSVYRPPIPAFISDGTYHNYLRPGESLMAVPLTDFGHVDAMVWQSNRNLDFRIAGGYFIGPEGDVTGGPADPTFTTARRPTTTLIAAATNPSTITDADRTQARVDLRYWKVAVVVLQPQYAAMYRPTLEALFGPATATGGLLIWNTAPLIR